MCACDFRDSIGGTGCEGDGGFYATCSDTQLVDDARQRQVCLDECSEVTNGLGTWTSIIGSVRSNLGIGWHNGFCAIEQSQDPDPEINCIFCLSPEIKDIFFDISDNSGGVSDFIFPNDASGELDTAITELMSCLQKPSFFNESCWISTIIDIGIRFDNISLVTEAIGNDPPDSNFETIYPIPVFEILESDGITPSSILLVNFANELSEQDAILQAFLVTLERYQGALIADEPEFVTLQLTALEEYTDLLVVNQLELSNASSEYSLLTQDIISEGGLELLQQRLDDEGFSQTEFDILVNLGYTQTEILEIQNIYYW